MIGLISGMLVSHSEIRHNVRTPTDPLKDTTLREMPNWDRTDVRTGLHCPREASVDEGGLTPRCLWCDV